MIPHESPPDSDLRASTITVRTRPLQQAADALVGDGSGGEYARFRADIDSSVPQVTAAAAGPDGPIAEGDWFRAVSSAQARALADFSDDVAHGVHALGNAAGYIAENYRGTDRSADRLMDDPDALLAALERDGVLGGPSSAA